jgi:hypothetical protein
MFRSQLADIILGAVFLFIGLASCGIAAIRRRSGVRGSWTGKGRFRKRETVYLKSVYNLLLFLTEVKWLGRV